MEPQVTVIRVPVPKGQVNLLDPAVIAQQQFRGDLLNAEAEMRAAAKKREGKQ